MGAFGSGDRWSDNPFVFFGTDEHLVPPQRKQDMPNPLRAMYEDLAPLLIRSPPSKRYPQQPTGRKTWDVLTEPISELIFSSAVPDPIIGETLQRTMRPTVEGKEGLATHLNILVDCSWSMSEEDTIYGMTSGGFPMGGCHLAQVSTAMMIAQAQISKDTFCVWGYAGTGYGVFPVPATPSGEHKFAIDYFLDNVPSDSNENPFHPNNSTHLDAGLDQVGVDLEGFTFDQSVTVVILDGCLSNERTVRRQLLNPDKKYTDKELREMGPVFYVLLANPNNIEQMDETAERITKVLSEEYGTNMEGFAKTFSVVVGEDGGVAGFAGTLCDMARINSGDSDLAKEIGIESAEEAAENTTT